MRNARLFMFVAIFPPLLAACGGSGGSSGPFVRVWGSSTPGSIGGGPTVAEFTNPANVAVAPSGVVYVADYDTGLIRQIQPDGIVSTLTSQANFSAPFGMTVTKSGKLYVETDADDKGAKNGTTGTIWSIDPVTGVATVAIRDIGRPRGLCGLTDGRIGVSDLVNNTISIFDPTTGKVTPVAGSSGNAGFKNGTGSQARFSRPYGLAQAADSSLLVADQTNNCIRRVTLDGAVTVYAGAGTVGSQNGSLTKATFNGPQGVAISPDGTVYVADTDGHVVRRIDSGQVFTEAGDAKAGFVDATGLKAEFYGLEGISLTSDGSVLWISDGNGGDGSDHNRVRRLKVP